MKVACLQFSPEHGNPTANMLKADILLSAAEPRLKEVSVLVLPEMIFSGYIFKGPRDIERVIEVVDGWDMSLSRNSTCESRVVEGLMTVTEYVRRFGDEDSDEEEEEEDVPIEPATFVQDLSLPSPTLAWARKWAIRLNTYIQVGLPRRDAASGALYNSTLLVNPSGELVHVYDKHFLFSDDERWATEGKGFVGRVPVPHLGQVGFGICMDVNPYRFQTPSSTREFASFHSSNSNLLLCSMAWVLLEQDNHWVEEQAGPMVETLVYWANRLEGLKGCVVVVANRVGKENGKYFAGTSCVLYFGPDGRVRLLGALGTREEGVLVVDDVPDCSMDGVISPQLSVS
ncbi:carbon-nitrogen hydrolase [Phlyctochytrium arcticum]|nr:carbon-nitrogen hydrolase [Phlyctochytrium arcticum]